MFKTHKSFTEKHIIDNVRKEPDETITTIRDKIEHFQKIAKAYNELVDSSDTKMQQTEDPQRLYFLRLERKSYIQMLRQINEKLTKLYKQAGRLRNSILVNRNNLTELTEKRMPYMAENIWGTSSEKGYGSRAYVENIGHAWKEQTQDLERKLGETVTSKGTYMDMRRDRYFPDHYDE